MIYNEIELIGLIACQLFLCPLHTVKNGAKNDTVLPCKSKSEVSNKIYSEVFKRLTEQKRTKKRSVIACF